MAWSLGWEPALAASGAGWRLPYLALLMNDPYHAVRFIAGRSARSAEEHAGLAYDHMAPPERRLELTSELLERWGRAQAPDGPARPELLLAAGGAWREEDVERLLEGRDNSDVVLQE
jgi:hypothetical protein